MPFSIIYSILILSLSLSIFTLYYPIINSLSLINIFSTSLSFTLSPIIPLFLYFITLLWPILNLFPTFHALFIFFFQLNFYLHNYYISNYQDLIHLNLILMYIQLIFYLINYHMIMFFVIIHFKCQYFIINYYYLIIINV